MDLYNINFNALLIPLVYICKYRAYIINFTSKLSTTIYLTVYKSIYLTQRKNRGRLGLSTECQCQSDKSTRRLLVEVTSPATDVTSHCGLIDLLINSWHECVLFCITWMKRFRTWLNTFRDVRFSIYAY